MIHYAGAMEKRAPIFFLCLHFVITGTFYNIFESKKLLVLGIISGFSISRVVLNWILFHHLKELHEMHNKNSS